MCAEGFPSEDCIQCVCDGHVLQGEVRSVTGAPVAEATVSLADHPKVALAQTDAAGHFSLPGVCSSSPTLLHVRKDRFSPVTVSTASNATGLSWVRAVLASTGES